MAKLWQKGYEVAQLLKTEKAFINDMDQLILAYNQQVDLEASRLKRLEHGLFLVGSPKHVRMHCNGV